MKNNTARKSLYCCFVLVTFALLCFLKFETKFVNILEATAYRIDSQPPSDPNYQPPSYNPITTDPTGNNYNILTKLSAFYKKVNDSILGKSSLNKDKIQEQWKDILDSTKNDDTSTNNQNSRMYNKKLFDRIIKACSVDDLVTAEPGDEISNSESRRTVENTCSSNAITVSENAAKTILCHGLLSKMLPPSPPPPPPLGSRLLGQFWNGFKNARRRLWIHTDRQVNSYTNSLLIELTKFTQKKFDELVRDPASMKSVLYKFLPGSKSAQKFLLYGNFYLTVPEWALAGRAIVKKLAPILEVRFHPNVGTGWDFIATRLCQIEDTNDNNQLQNFLQNIRPSVSEHFQRMLHYMSNKFLRKINKFFTRSKKYEKEPEYNFAHDLKLPSRTTVPTTSELHGVQGNRSEKPQIQFDEPVFPRDDERIDNFNQGQAPTTSRDTSD